MGIGTERFQFHLLGSEQEVLIDRRAGGGSCLVEKAHQNLPNGHRCLSLATPQLRPPNRPSPWARSLPLSAPCHRLAGQDQTASEEGCAEGTVRQSCEGTPASVCSCVRVNLRCGQDGGHLLTSSSSQVRGPGSTAAQGP